MATQKAALAFEDFTRPLPSHVPLSSEREGGHVIKPGLELFHKVSAPDRTPGKAEDNGTAQYEMGLAEGTRRAAELHSATIAVMQDSLISLQESFMAQIQALNTQNQEAVTQIFERLLPALSQHGFAAEFQMVIGKLIDANIVGPINITCAESDVDDIKNLVSKCPDSELFKLKPQKQAPQKIELNWPAGGALIDYSHTIETANALIRKHLSSDSQT